MVASLQILNGIILTQHNWHLLALFHPITLAADIDNTQNMIHCSAAVSYIL
jgi:hypothetical protein